MARRPTPPVGTTEHKVASESDLVDESLEETFPASDPPSCWAGPDRDRLEDRAPRR